MKLRNKLITKKNVIIKNTKRIPNVGEVWCHETDNNNIYMRITDINGVLSINGFCHNYFVSVSLENGKIVQTPMSNNIIITLGSISDITTCVNNK